MALRLSILIDAEDILLAPLVVAFNQMLSTGVPQSWCTGVIHPIFKAGDVNDPNNYRGITVTSVLAKLFAMVLEARMSKWAESHELRADGQAGFRKDHRTVDNVFIMQALIKDAHKSKKKLYCCFVDFKKAFDSVPRQRLWEVLSSVGVQGDILECLKSMYAQDEACVLTQAGLTDAFRCTIGVKQGCPASPLLFGLFLDDLEAKLQAESESIDAPSLLGTLIAILLFADDIALMSHSAEGLQHQLSILAQFCKDRGLTVNVGKTKIVIFEHKRSECMPFMFEGREIERVDIFKYLGIAFHATRGLTCAMEQLCSSARKAVFALHGRCHEMHITSPALQLMLFDALVRPVLSYCCEVWLIFGTKGALQSLEQVQTQFLRQLLGASPKAATKFVRAEFGRLPLKFSWLQQCLKYLQRFSKMSDHRLVKKVFLADQQLGLGWFSGLKDELREFQLRMPRCLTDWDFAASLRELKDKSILAAMSPDPESHLQVTYYSLKTEYRLEPYITQSKSARTRSIIARYRTGSHWLQVAEGRRLQVPYDQRFCPVCEGCVEDEVHAIFDCKSYVWQRLQFEDLFEQPAGAERSLRAFLASNPPHRVADFLESCHRATHDDHYANVILRPVRNLVPDDYDSSNDSDAA
jgi:hypothetical protein